MRYLHALAKTVAAAALLVVVLLPVARTGGPGGGAEPASAAYSGSPAYWLIASNGTVYQRGTVNYGDMSGYQLARPVVGGSATNDGGGYWMVASDGGIFAFGDAAFHGSTGGVALVRPIVGMAADPTTSGYWMVASDGGVFALAAGFYGSTGGVRLDQPIVGMAPTPDGKGYWLVASDGGVFAFGDAGFYGSTGGVRLDQPIVGMAPTPDGKGYWLVASDGGIFAFGDAGFHGSTGGVHLAAPVVGMSASPDGGGYWLVARDGGVFPYGDAPFLGAAGTGGIPPVVGLMSTPHGYPFPPNSTGNDVSQWQCPYYRGGSLPTTQPAVAIVQVSGGAIDLAQPSQCFPLEAQWAGENMSVYIYMDPVPSPPPAQALSGPAGQCAAGQATCESFNYGYHWATYWVDYARADGTNPRLWWLDVETTGGVWNLSSAAQPANAQVIAGAVAGLRSRGVVAGIYSTHLQWGEITGFDVTFPHIPLWEAGAYAINSGPNSAYQMCVSPDADHAPFAGGSTVVVQYGYDDPNKQFDEDYACP